MLPSYLSPLRILKRKPNLVNTVAGGVWSSNAAASLLLLLVFSGALAQQASFVPVHQVQVKAAVIGLTWSPDGQSLAAASDFGRVIPSFRKMELKSASGSGA